MEPRTEDLSVSARPVTIPALFAAVVLAIAACSASTGGLGSPNSPAVTQDPSGQPAPSDAAPGTPTPTASDAPSDVPSTPGSQPPSSTPPTPTPTPAGTTIVRAYFVMGSFNGNEGIAPVLREVPATKAVARAAMTQLLGGPQGSELEGSPAMFSFIPDGTQLIDLSIDNGVATVTLSKAFAQATDNVRATTARAQVVYTLTQFTSVDAVRIAVEGSDPEPAANRADFQSIALPAIFVDRPAWNAAAGNPAHVTGLANVFEATFRVQILDGKGNVLADKQVMATCGTGCWGSFKTDVPYTIGKAQYGTLRVFDLSAKDGTPENVTEYRVWLTPAS
jgi:immunoglobulin-like protein involved in spore germination/sporulation and spore germination protein